MRSALHEAARTYAAAGTPVFPCHPDTKTPATDHGFHDASADLAQIDAWWSENPAYNIAFSPHTVGLGVVDIDGAAGEAAWLDLSIVKGEPPATYEVGTPRGGRHLYYRGELRGTQSILGPHIDTRGRGSYALLPPSTFEGKPYIVLENRQYADVPEWIPNALADAQKAKTKAAGFELDLPTNVSRAASLLRQYVAAGKVAVEGEMGDGLTYQTACEVLNLGLSEERALDLIDTEWNPHCLPPWSRDDLAAKVSNAAAYAQNEPGAWATAPASEVFGPTLDKLGLTSDEPGRRSRFHLYSEDEQDAMQEPTWLFPDLLPAESTAMLYGASGGYKSFLALDLALTLASGIEGFGAPAREPQAVVYVAAEGPRSVSRYRRPAWRLARGVEGPLPFHLVTDMPLVGVPQMLGEFIDEIKRTGVKPKLIVLDTLARAMAGLNENDAKDAGQFIEAAEALKREFGCSVLVVHHTGKEEGRGARGSSALLAGFDAAIEVKATRETKAVALWPRKQKDADLRAKPWMFEGKELAGTLVFFPVDAAAYRTLTNGDDVLAGSKIGAALAELGARGENMVTTRALAHAMTPHEDGMTDEMHAEAVSRTEKALRPRRHGTGEAYAVGDGQALRWRIP